MDFLPLFIRKTTSVTDLLSYILCNSEKVSSNREEYPSKQIYKSTAGQYQPIRVADGPITACYRFIKNASWDAPKGEKIPFQKGGEILLTEFPSPERIPYSKYQQKTL